MAIKLLSSTATMQDRLWNNSLNQLHALKDKPAKFWLQETGILVIIGAIYFIGAKFGLELAFVQSNATAVWPPTGIALAAVLLLGYRIWPGILVGAFLANETTAGNFITSLAIATGNTLEAVVGGWLVIQFAGGLRAFEHPRTFVRYVILAAGLATGISATIGVSSLTITGFSSSNQYLNVWFTWWLGDMISNLIVAPWIILLFTHLWTKPSVKRVLTIVLTFLVVLIAGGFIFFNWLQGSYEFHSLTYLILPLLLVVAFRFGSLGVSTAMLGTAFIAISAVLRGYGPFATSDQNVSLLLVQTFLGTISITMLIIASILKERGQAQQALVRANEQLRDKEQRMRFQAFHDLLTNLPNRSALEERLALAIEIAKRHNGLIAVLFIDFDNFKIINDSYGHSTGDHILKLAAQRFISNVRAEDTVARIGGDEFVVLLSEIQTQRDVIAVADVMLHALHTPFIIGDSSLSLSVSIGISMFPTDGETVSALLFNADIALYRAKQSGRNRFCFFDESSTEQKIIN